MGPGWPPPLAQGCKGTRLETVPISPSCAALSPMMRVLIQGPRTAPAHDLRVARVLSIGLPVVFCRRCGSYTASGKLKDLAGPCTKAKPRQLKGFLDGRILWPKGAKGRVSRFWIPQKDTPEWWVRLAETVFEYIACPIICIALRRTMACVGLQEHKK